MRIEDLLSDNLVKKIDERKDKVKSLFDNSSENATIIIGAGISCSAGLPGWGDLLKALSYIAFKTDIWELLNCDYDAIPEIYRDNEKNKPYLEEYKNFVNIFAGTDLLEVAEYLNLDHYIIKKEGKTTEETFTLNGLIKLALKNNCRLNELINECTKCPGQCNINNDNKKCILNRSVGKLAKLLYNNIKKNLNLNYKVITYNYDNTFEFCLKNMSDADDKNLYESLFDENRPSSDVKIHIYHPHGYLNITELEDYNGGKIRDSKKCVLTESSYYEIEKYQYCWENHILAGALNDSSCVFFGFSGNDYNFKRILKNIKDAGEIEDICEEDRRHHYIIVTIDDMVSALYDWDEKCGRTVEEGKLSYESKILLNRSLALKEMYWGRKNILPIWTTIDELPELIESMCP